MRIQSVRMVAVVLLLSSCASAPQDQPGAVGPTTASSAPGVPPTPSAGPTTTASPPALDQQRAAKLEASLTSPIPQRAAQVLADGVRQTYLADPTPLLPAGSRLSLDRVHAQATAATLLDVPATVTGTDDVTTSWTVRLIKQGGTWNVYAASPRTP